MTNPTNRLNKEIVNERIKDRGIELIGDYTNNRTSSLFRCSEGHIWSTTPAVIVSGYGCPTCSGVAKLSKEIVNERIKHRGMELIGDYISANHSSLFRCANNHTWETSPSNVYSNRTGCPTCNGHIPLTKEIVNERIKDRGIELIGDYINTNTRSLFRGSCNHEWKARPNDVLQGSGCRVCSNISHTLTKEIVNERIKDRGIELIGDYTNIKTCTLFRGSCNHEWKATPNDVLQGTGCSTCNGHIPLTKEMINERIKGRGIELIGGYINKKHRTLFRGLCNHEWETLPDGVIHGTGCPTCSGNLPLTKEIVNERIKGRGIELIGDYTNVGKRSSFRCSNNHEWKTSPHSVMRGSACPLCFGSAKGFKCTRPGHGYLLNFGYFIKFGISNVLPRRLSEHKRYNGKFSVIKTKLFENGQDALDWENSIKKRFGGNYVSRDICPDGFTETLSMCLKEALVETL